MQTAVAPGRPLSMELTQALAEPFGQVNTLIDLHVRQCPEQAAIADDQSSWSWRQFGESIDRIAISLHRDGVRQRDIVALLGVNSIRYAAAFLAILRLGAIPAPLSNSSMPAAIGAMLADCGTRWLFVDPALQNLVPPTSSSVQQIPLNFPQESTGDTGDAWLARSGVAPELPCVAPGDPFNVIYSSGTTGTPKGIVQSHAMRWAHIQRGIQHSDYTRESVLLLSTPLYSNTTLATFVPAVGAGARIVLMAKFDARRFLEIAQRERATHYILVPVQYRRIMALPDFGAFDLSSCRLKSSTSAPFPAELKDDVLRRWPGGLIDVYGMTEGGGTCILTAHEHPDKLHTVGQPLPGHDIRLIDEQGVEVPRGSAGEVVGRSKAMMEGYLGQPEKTREAEWYDATGKRYIRHGDIGRFDEDGFLVLLDRAKDMIISGGFNIYPSDLEAALKSHPDVVDAAVVAAPSEAWGETPVGFVVLRQGAHDASGLLAYANGNLGKTQRLTSIYIVEELPRSAIGKVLKRELRDRAKGSMATVTTPR